MKGLGKSILGKVKSFFGRGGQKDEMTIPVKQQPRDISQKYAMPMVRYNNRQAKIAINKRTKAVHRGQNITRALIGLLNRFKQGDVPYIFLERVVRLMNQQLDICDEIGMAMKDQKILIDAHLANFSMFEQIKFADNRFILEAG